ncbi:MAG TPA: 16S rRNA (cytidine(1402)-2'-O)-methyltransferase [Acidimicrobiales bacterium]|nr:16S rRNA (cytidine(1402)-2'-O)-methyltransferase [Acidimicrobiales bacterium]
MTAAGELVLVSTPIGNLGDLSPRAVAALRECDLLCCEDTRRTRQLLTHAGITGKDLVSVHGHNENARIRSLLERLAAGDRVALVSDAGMPGVSDPGVRLVAAAARAGVRVTVVPGPNAALSALVVSGLPTDRFCFEGFLPRRGSERRRRLEEIAAEQRTVVLHETAPRLVATLQDLVALCGPGRRVAVVRELTKAHEEVWRSSLADAVTEFTDREARGEIVLVLHGGPPPAGADDDDVREAVRGRREEGASLRDAAAAVAEELGVPKRRAYEIGLADQRNAGP